MTDDEKLKNASLDYVEVLDKFEGGQEKYWDSLSGEDQLKAFCAVVRRIYRGELVDKGSYRHVLYNVFGFGPEAYVQAQLAGYLAIHNCIFDAEHEKETLTAFAKSVNVDPSKVDDFYMGKFLKAELGGE
jgi:hypothetical protein